MMRLEGRGWHGEPMRHSLAARGIPTYLYHGTTSESLKGIIKDRGIVPWKDKIYSISDDYVYLTIDEYSGDFWARKARKIVEDETGIEMTGVLLRVKKDELLKIGDILPDDEVSGESYMFTGNIPLDLIEMKTSVGWMGLEEYENLTSKGVPIYLYHGTTTGRFRDIKREGLSMDPGFRNWSDSEFIYFTMDEENARSWAEHATRMYKEEYWDYPKETPGYVSKTKPLILRVSKEDLEEEDLIEDPIWDEPDSDPDLPWIAYLNDIPPELIEVKTPTGWKRLKSKNFNPKFITGGDGVGREYHGYDIHSLQM